MDLATRIASWRKAKGFSQRQLAMRLKLSPAAVSLWEKGGGVKFENAKALARAFGISAERFIFGAMP